MKSHHISNHYIKRFFFTYDGASNVYDGLVRKGPHAHDGNADGSAGATNVS